MQKKSQNIQQILTRLDQGSHAYAGRYYPRTHENLYKALRACGSHELTKTTHADVVITGKNPGKKSLEKAKNALIISAEKLETLLKQRWNERLCGILEDLNKSSEVSPKQKKESHEEGKLQQNLDLLLSREATQTNWEAIIRFFDELPETTDPTPFINRTIEETRDWPTNLLVAPRKWLVSGILSGSNPRLRIVKRIPKSQGIKNEKNKTSLFQIARFFNQDLVNVEPLNRLQSYCKTLEYRLGDWSHFGATVVHLEVKGNGNINVNAEEPSPIADGGTRSFEPICHHDWQDVCEEFFENLSDQLHVIDKDFEKTKRYFPRLSVSLIESFFAGQSVQACEPFDFYKFFPEYCCGGRSIILVNRHRSLLIYTGMFC